MREVEVARADPKVDAGCGLDAVRLSTVVHVVEVEAEDLRLRAVRFELERDRGLMRLADEKRRVIVREVEPAGELLRDRGRARWPHPVAEGARDSERVDSRMTLEAAVLGRDRCLEHCRRDRVERDWNADAVAAVVCEHGPVGVDHDRARQAETRLGRIKRREARERRQADEHARREERGQPEGVPSHAREDHVILSVCRPRFMKEVLRLR